MRKRLLSLAGLLLLAAHASATTVDTTTGSTPESNTGSKPASAVTTQNFEAAGLAVVVVINTSGRSEVVAQESAGPIRVEVEKIEFPKECTLKTERRGSVLLLEVRNSGFTGKGNCEANLRATVPAGADVRITEGSGAVKVKGMKGELTFKSGSGAVVAEGAFSKVTGLTGSGAIELTGLNGSADLQSGSGQVTARVPHLPAKGQIDVESASGAATLFVPKRSRLKSEVSSVSGRVENDLKSDPQALISANVSSASGAASLKTF